MALMKKALSCFLFFLTLFPSLSSAADLTAPGTMTRKLQRGFVNIALSPMEIGNEIVKTQPYDTALPTWAAGIIKGSFMTVSRALVGAYEIVTAPIPVPQDYAPVLYPEFPWEPSKTRAEQKEKKAETI